jgi:hypothetical protein
MGSAHHKVSFATSRTGDRAGGRLVKLEFNDDARNELGREAARQGADRMQGVFDRVLELGEGKPVQEVKVILAREWRSAFGGDITDPELSRDAALLAAGHRIEARPDIS